MKISEFLFENFPFLFVKFSIYLHRRVFVIKRSENTVVPLLSKQLRKAKDRCLLIASKYTAGSLLRGL